MDLLNIIKTNRLRLGAPNCYYPFLSAAVLVHQKALHGLLSRNVSGILLDIGAGASPYRQIINPSIERYFSLDISVRSLPLDCVGDVERLPFKDGSANTILCTQVLEHVPHPHLALKEMCRVLKKGGKLILTVPHLSRIHEAPHDYFRFTQYGIWLLCEESGFRILSVDSVGGLLSFLGHTFSTLFLGLFGVIPGVRRLAYFVNLAISYGIIFVDTRIDKLGIFAINYHAVLEKPHG